MLRNRILTGALALSLGAAAVATNLPNFFQAPQATEDHARLMHAVGNWEGTITMWMGGAEMASPCTETVTAIGDMWTTSSFACEFGGIPFVGSSTNGYDPEKGMYVSTWVDSMTTTMTMMEGKWDAEKNATVMTFESLDAMTGEMASMMTETTVDRENFKSVFYKMVDGKPERSMMIDMTRVADSEAHEASAGRGQEEGHDKEGAREHDRK